MNPSPPNPFATRFTRPGALPFLFSEDEDETLQTLLDRLRAHGWCGEIVGPHGSGKTTLLTHLLEFAADTGQRVARFTLHDGQRRLPSDWQTSVALASMAAVDGYEQLGWWARRRLERTCRNRGVGLIVTAHARTGLPTLYRTRPSLPVARKVIERLLPSSAAPTSDDELAHLFDVFHGNLREILFALYDRYEPLGSSASADPRP